MHEFYHAKVDSSSLRLDIDAPESVDEIDTWGAVVAVCTVLTILENPSLCPAHEPWFTGPLGWELVDVLALPEPVPVKGKQGLWTLPEDVAEQVNRQAGRLHTEVISAP